MTFGAYSYLTGSEFDTINSLTERYVVDVIQVASNGSKTYQISQGYAIDAFIVNSANKYAGGGNYDVPANVSVSQGVVTWTTDKASTIVVVIKNV